MSEELSFEKAIKRLEEVVLKLEEPEIAIEEAMKLYQEGMKLSKYCNTVLVDAEKQMTEIIEKDGTIKPFDVQEEDE